VKEKIDALWTEALGQTLGLRVQTDDPTALMDALLASRVGRPELFSFTIQIRGEEVWLIRITGAKIRTDGEFSPLEE
jgi:hypothetical protein